MKPEELLKISEEIREKNPFLYLTGSLSLYVRGINLGRPIKDIDMFGYYESKSDIVLDDRFEIIEEDIDDYGDSECIQYEYEGITIDILNEEINSCECVNGYLVAKINDIIWAKISHISNGTNRSNKIKHAKDIIILSEYSDFDFSSYVSRYKSLFGL